VRFAFGGLVTVATGLVAHRWGPAIAGLFLAFPSILPASLTLVKQHDGRSCAADDARGARLGTAGLAAFAVVVAAGAGHLPAPLLLAAASVAWLLAGVLLWVVRYGRG
jgi:hypothetical protein